MPNLKATLNFVSNDLFPIPVNFTDIATESINGNHSSFQTQVLAGLATNINLYSAAGPYPPSGVVYFYFKADASNAGTVDVEIAAGPTRLLRLYPGDVAFFPMEVGAAVSLQADNNSASQSILYFFYGEKD